MTSVNMVREQYVGEKKSIFCPNIPNDIFEGLEVMEGICIPTKEELDIQLEVPATHLDQVPLPSSSLMVEQK